MTLAIMTRASLGHTDRALRAGLLTQAIYLTVVIAAVFRITAALMPGAMTPMLHAAGAAWIAAFWMFAASYGPLLASRRSETR